MVQFLLAGAFTLEALLEANTKGSAKLRSVLERVFLGVVLLLLAFINPQGSHIFESPAAVWAIRARIDEWQPLLFSRLNFYFLMLYATILLWAFWHNRLKVRLSEPILFTVMVGVNPVGSSVFPAVRQDLGKVQVLVADGYALRRGSWVIPGRRFAAEGQAEKNNQEEYLAA